MASGVFGGGLIFVVAALLWAAVLVPSWVRRREFKSAEQNALRLQRTLRVLAETAEVPTEVRVEATAREALAQERLLRTAQRRQEAERKAELTEARTAQIRAEMRAQQVRRKQAALVRSAKLRRPFVRRVRSFSALVLVIALAAMLIGAGTLIAGLGPSVLLGGLAATVTALGALFLLAPGRVKHVEIEAEQVVPSTRQQTQEVLPETVQTDRSGEVHAAAQAAAAARIARARAMARSRAEGAQVPLQNQSESILLERAEARVADSEPNASVRVQEQAPSRESLQEAASARSAVSAQAHALAAEIAVSERLRQMGVIGDTSDGALDLDAILKSRRAS